MSDYGTDKGKTTRINVTKEFEEKRKRINNLASFGFPAGMRTAFEIEWHKNFFLRDTHLSGEPTLEDEVTINGDKWEIWQGRFEHRGCFGGVTYVLILQRICEKKEPSVWDFRHYSWNTLGSSYLDWKWFHERKGDTVEAFLTRLINEEEHGGLLSKVDYQERGTK